MIVGAKYESTRDLDTPEIAKLVRRDLREQFPGYAFRVRISRGRMRDCIDVSVLRVPYDGPLRWDELQKFRNVVNAYGYDRSDARVDHCDTRFHVWSSFHSSLCSERRGAA